MLPMNELALFAAVARAGSISGGARSVGISKAAASEQLRRLEHKLGSPLMVRSTRRLSLTEAGSACLSHAQQMVDSARAAAEAAEQLHGEARGLLRVAAPTGLGQRRVVPALATLCRQFPKLSVELSLGAGRADLIAERIDVAIRIGDLPDSRLVARRLGMQQLSLHASPDYLRRRGTPASPDALAAHAVLEFLPLGWRGQWRLIGPSRRAVALRIDPAFATDCGEALLAATVAGTGIAALPGWLAEKEVEMGALVPVLHGWHTRAVPIQAVYRSAGRLPVKTRVFLQHLAAEFAAAG
jgi:molybdate transport repressor ModE-like protein